MRAGRYALKVIHTIIMLQCKVDNNTGRIPPLTSLSTFDHQVWRLSGIRVVCGSLGSSEALEQVFYIYCPAYIGYH